jgi:transposase-like protein
MTFMNTRIDHELSEEEKKWIEEEAAEQEARYAKIAQEMGDLAPTREKWYQEFFDRITTIGFNVDGDDKVVIEPGQLPVKPDDREDQVIWKYGTDSVEGEE